MRRLVLLSSLLAVLAGLLACEVFNKSCPVTTPEVWGKGLAVDLDIREEFVRQCEAPVGNFLADALRPVLADPALYRLLDEAGLPADAGSAVAS